MRPLLLVAASGLAREVAEAARAGGREVLGCVDDDRSTWGSTAGPAGPVLGGLSTVSDHPEAQLVLCAGRGAVRRDLLHRLSADGGGSLCFASVVHPSVTVPTSCRVGEGTVLLAGTVLTASVSVGRHVVCMPRVVLTHDDRVEDFATLCAGVTLGGHVTVGEAAYLGMSACVRERLTVGDSSTLGMGGVLVRDLPPGDTWVGNPASPVPQRPSEEVTTQLSPFGPPERS